MKAQAVVRLDRLRLGEWIMLAASIALVIDLAAFPWYSERTVYEQGLSELGRSGYTVAAGHAYPILTPLAIICIILTWAICVLQVLQPGPALPLAMTVIATMLEIVLSVCLLIRVVFDQYSAIDLGTGANQVKPDVASVAGLFFAVLLLYGAWRSLRADGIPEADSPHPIETLRLTPRGR